MKQITKYFLQGLIVILPTTATIYLLYFLFVKIDGLFNFKIPGIGFVITIAIVITTGVVASNFLTRRAISFMDEVFGRLPLVKIIYNAIKDLVEAFVGDKKKFNRPVLIKVSNESSIELFGFITEDDLSYFGEQEKIAVYIPQSYNFAGNLFVVPKESIRILNAGAKEVMTFIVSGGLSK